MADDNQNSRHPTDQVGKVSTKIQSELEDRLADLKQLLETNPALSSTEAAHVEANEDAFPNHPPSDTYTEPLGLNNLVDNIWDLRRKQERRFDPLLYLGDDMMHEILLYAVSLWDIAESKAWGTKGIPRNHISDPLALASVNRRWSQIITSSPQIWSYLLIDTDGKDIMEYLQLSFLLSRNRPLFVILDGSGDMCDDIVMDLLRVGDRIDTLLYPPNVSHSTLAKFRLYIGASHSQLQHVCPWYKLEVQSAMQPQRDIYHYSFPTSIQNLWMGGLFPLSKLVALSHFQSLSSLSVRISVDRGIPLAHNYRLELPNLEIFRVQMAVVCHRQVETPIFMSCRKLKLLDLRYALEFNLESPQDEPVTWMEFDIVDALEELQIDLAIHVVPEVHSNTRLVEWLKMRLWRQEQWLEQQQQWPEQEQRWAGREELEELEEELRELQGELAMKEVQLLLKEQLLLKKEGQLWKERQLQYWQQRKEQQQQQWEKLLQTKEELLQKKEQLLELLQKKEQQLEQLEQLQKKEQQLEQLEQLEQLVEWLEQQQQQVEQEMEQEMEKVEQKVEWLEQRMQQQQQRMQQELEEMGLELEEENPEELQELQEQENQELQERRLQEIRQQQQHLRFMMSIRTRWPKWLNLPDYLEHVQRSSLKVSLSTQLHKETWEVIRDTVEEVLLRRLPQITELTTSKVLHIFPEHLRKLRFHCFAISDSWPSMTLPSLVSLEIIADSPDHLLVLKYIQVPQLRVLRVQVEDGPGTLQIHDWGDNTSNILDHISLRIEIPLDKQGDIHVLVFHLPQTHSLNVFSPYIPLHLYLAKPAPSIYTLNAGLGTMSGPSRGHFILSATWNEELVTEWIIPYGIPSLVKFEALTSLQRIVLDQRPYLLSEQSPADTLFKLLEQNIHTCPQLTSIALSQCPSSWPRFLCQLRTRNRGAMLSRRTKCIDELGFYQPLHATIIRWLVDGIKAKNFNMKEHPPIREGNAWPMRPFEAEHTFRSCYICHITGMELGCYESETQKADCGRQRGDGSKIVVS